MPADTGIDVGRSRAADAILATTLLVVVVTLGLTVRVPPQPLGVGIGGLGTLAAEGVAYQYCDRVRAAWRRQPVRVVSIFLSLAGITIGTAVAPAMTLSAAFGALGTYLGLLGLVSLPNGSTQRS